MHSKLTLLVAFEFRFWVPLVRKATKSEIENFTSPAQKASLLVAFLLLAVTPLNLVHGSMLQLLQADYKYIRITDCILLVLALAEARTVYLDSLFVILIGAFKVNACGRLWVSLFGFACPKSDCCGARVACWSLSWPYVTCVHFHLSPPVIAPLHSEPLL